MATAPTSLSAAVAATASYTYSNWQRARRNERRQETSEAPLFTDTWITGQVEGMGPYAFLNTIAHANVQPGQLVRPAVVMRINHHWETVPDRPLLPMENDFEHYHGGDYLDEMAALASLFIGRRFKAGGVNRHFRGDDDRFGSPVQYGGKPQPQLLLEGRPQVPRLALSGNLNEGLQPLGTFPNRSVDQTNALIKAARQYQQAIWIADSEPSLAWLMLVSAIEIAAQECSSDSEPVEQLELAFPELVKLIQESKSPELLERTAQILSQLTRSTKKFVGFIEVFAPPPPDLRPEGYLQFSYSPTDLRKAASLIYGHRSMSLHRGTAFPQPMCEPPQFAKQGDVVSGVQEKPMGLAASSRNASWRIEKTPMLLNTFEHIARGSLLNWWKSLQ